MASTIIICGWLTKEGARGHRVQNSKKRWFVLQDGFLSYFEDNPAFYKGKNIHNFKGRIFLCGCLVAESVKPLSFMFRTPTKDFIITGTSESEISCWKNALDYAIQAANDDFEDKRPLTGWLNKKGGLGHKYTNWQKRWFKLQGALLSYYSDEVKKSDEAKYLKGTIDVTMISELTPNVTGSKNNCFSILVNNEKEFIFSASTAEEKQTWIDEILNVKEKLAQKYGIGRLGIQEEVICTSLPQVRVKGSWKKLCFCLTNKNIRFYKSQRILDDEESWNFLSGLLISIPLFGTTLHVSSEAGARVIHITDIRGTKYTLKGGDSELLNLYEEMTNMIRSLLMDIISEGSSIRLNCYASMDGPDQDHGYTIITVDQISATFRFLLTDHTTTMSLSRINGVSVNKELEKLVISYTDEENEKKELSFRTESAFSLSDIFNHLRGESSSPKELWDAVSLDSPDSRTVSTDITTTKKDPTSSKSKKKDQLSLEDFELIRVVGRGAFGKVLLCKLVDTNQTYAMKCILKKSLVRHKKEIEHTLAERSVMMKLDHPFLMKLHYTFQTDDKLIYVMDYVNGGELFFHLEREGTFDMDRARFYMAELISAISYLHESDIVYRDIKTENILLNSEGHVVLTDFGLSKELGDADQRTGTLCGTPVYLPPEMLKKQEYGKAVDFWSVGVLLFEMLTGDVPFYNDNIQKMFRMIVQDEVPYPDFLIGTPVQDLIDRLLQKNPEDRLTDWDEIKSHPFFECINWEALVRKEIPPPFVPTVSLMINLIIGFREIRYQEYRC
eukprot:TRINITY_DN4054_c0_g1_i3.p1 TRINITY_DN4054_c0_g1~~TRINITY_DN4054_c0_g1_i3.p1  ORF type:complete len:784 (+),score=156.57 TRINITY_DN4054_c0_g1_i3:168-2519(+)